MQDDAAGVPPLDDGDEASDSTAMARLRGFAAVHLRSGLDWQKILNISELIRVLVSRCCFLWDLSWSLGRPRSPVPVPVPSSVLSVAVSSETGFGVMVWRGICLIVDLALGMCLVSWIMQDGGIHCSSLLGSCLQMLRSGVFNLTGVIDWLMNNPAGLKLNKELAHTLGTFFKHHISLWQMYIVYLTSFLEGHESLLCSFGYLGVSFHAALIADCISLFTVHVHCFYIYMARLFNIQLHGLVSLGRFFRGKKWNPLRKRVDHVSSSVDQLFVGSLIMMVFMFLLPTIMTFYFVFASLHVVVRTIQFPFRTASQWMELILDGGKVNDSTIQSCKNLDATHSSTKDTKRSDVGSSCWKLLLGEVL